MRFVPRPQNHPLRKLDLYATLASSVLVALSKICRDLTHVTLHLNRTDLQKAANFRAAQSFPITTVSYSFAKSHQIQRIRFSPLLPEGQIIWLAMPYSTRLKHVQVYVDALRDEKDNVRNVCIFAQTPPCEPAAIDELLPNSGFHQDPFAIHAQFVSMNETTELQKVGDALDQQLTLADHIDYMDDPALAHTMTKFKLAEGQGAIVFSAPFLPSTMEAKIYFVHEKA
ncbi:hypothetical protein BC940DRAFT_323529 [Gongronella butleri]|nr:hypothetical protein BC940DRAFT_323529 [Gongronella butleri]